MREPAVKKNLDVDQAIRAACLSFPLRSHGRGKSLRYTILSYVQTNRDLKDCLLHLRYESNSAIEQDEARLVHIARVSSRKFSLGGKLIWVVAVLCHIRGL